MIASLSSPPSSACSNQTETTSILQLPAKAKQTPSPKPPEACVICLEPVSERAVAVPCNHCSFDFLCITTWLQANSSCPLCKAKLTKIEYDWRSPSDFKTYLVPSPTETEKAPSISSRSRFNSGIFPTRRSWHPYPQNRLPNSTGPAPALDHALSRRRYVYRYRLYSLHVGSNRLSAYSDFTPQSLSRSLHLQSRARKWIRRELRVFDFLGTERSRNRSNNAEFVLEYIMSILKSVDIKASSGDAQKLLSDFLGEDNAHLFLHELGAWLRSPYEELERWDRNVQYREELPGMDPESLQQPEQDRRRVSWAARRQPWQYYSD